MIKMWPIANIVEHLPMLQGKYKWYIFNPLYIGAQWEGPTLGSQQWKEWGDDRGRGGQSGCRSEVGRLGPSGAPTLGSEGQGSERGPNNSTRKQPAPRLRLAMGGQPLGLCRGWA